LLEQRLQRMHGPLAVEHVAGAQRELAGEPPRELLVDALKLDAVNRPLVDVDAHHTGCRIERHLCGRETVTFVAVFPLDALRDAIHGAGLRFSQRLAYYDSGGTANGVFRQLPGAGDPDLANDRRRLN